MFHNDEFSEEPETYQNFLIRNKLLMIDIEKRFKFISGLNLDMTVNKIVEIKSQVETNKSKSKEHSEVFTPLWLVDDMIDMKFNDITPKSITCDLCAGYGQFSIRLLRKLVNKYNIDVNSFLKDNHYFTEFQASSCAKLCFIFGNNINLYVGDSKNLPMSEEDDKGVLFFDEKEKKWCNIDIIDKLLALPNMTSNLKYLTVIFSCCDSIDKLNILYKKLKMINIVADIIPEKELPQIPVIEEPVDSVISHIVEKKKIKDKPIPKKSNLIL